MPEMLNPGYSAQGRDKVLQAYRQSRVETASPGELVLMLYNACLRNMKDAIACISREDVPTANSHLLKAQDIVDELRGSLNHETGEIARRLDSLYDYVYDCLLRANLRKDPRLVEDALKVMTQIRDAWQEVVVSHD